MTLRIDKKVEAKSTVLRLIGRVRSEYLDELNTHMTSRGKVILDLEEVSLVDVGVVKFLLAQELHGVELRNCPGFVREWILRERDERGKP